MPSTPPASPAQLKEPTLYDERDEISLRDLYLTARRGLPLIALFTVLAGVAAFLAVGLGGRRYQAAAAVQVTPFAVQQGTAGGLDLRSATTIDFETYQALAFSPAVLAAAGEALGAEGPARAELRAALNLTRLTGNTSASLVVRHTATDRLPERAAAVANTWAEATRSAVEKAVVDALASLSGGLSSQVEQARLALDEAEAAWQAFQQNDRRAELRARLDALGTRASEGRNRLDELERLEATAKAQQGLLTAIVANGDQGNPATLNEQLQVLQANGVVDEAHFEALLQALATTGAGQADTGTSLAYAIAQSRLQQQTAELAGYVAERAAIQAQLDGSDEMALALRTELAQLDRDASNRNRALMQAQAAYQQVQDLTPQLAVMTDLSASGARVLNPAVTPEHAQPTRREVTALAAAAAGLILGTLLVFVRAAIAEPAGPRPIAAPADAAPRRTAP